MTPAERAERCMGWRRQRPALESIAHGEPASWRCFDWQLGVVGDEIATCEPTKIVLFDGTFSARPELADLVGFTVLVDVPAEGDVTSSRDVRAKASWPDGKRGGNRSRSTT